jgi:hypothetical protein
MGVTLRIKKIPARAITVRQRRDAAPTGQRRAKMIPLRHDR